MISPHELVQTICGQEEGLTGKQRQDLAFYFFIWPQNETEAVNAHIKGCQDCEKAIKQLRILAEIFKGLYPTKVVSKNS